MSRHNQRGGDRGTGGAHEAGTAPDAGRPAATTDRTSGAGSVEPALRDEEVLYRASPGSEASSARRARFDLPATLGGALAALGTLLLLSSVLGAVGDVGAQSGIEGQDLSVAGVVAGLVSLFLAALVGGWVAGRIARHHGARHGLVAVVWLVVLAAGLALLAWAVGGDWDLQERIGLPSWFDEDAWGVAALVTGLVALALLLLGGWLGGRLADRQRASRSVEVVETRRAVTTRSGGLGRGTDR